MDDFNITQYTNKSMSTLRQDLCLYDIQKLTVLKNELDNIYYNTGNSTGWTDEQYDVLAEICTKNTGCFPVHTQKLVTLPCWLGSMDKYKYDTVDTHINKVNNRGNDTYIIQEKLDGVSCLCVMNNTTLKLYTRGDGLIGTDISHLGPYLQTIYNPYKSYKGPKLVIRGELIIKKEVFYTKYKDLYANPRNMVSGKINSKNPNKKEIADITFIPYEIIGLKLTPLEQLNMLSNNKFETIQYTLLNNIDKNRLKETLIDFKEKSLFEIDGIIVQKNTVYTRNTTGNPSYAFAFKMQLDEDIVQTRVIDIEWNITKSNKIKPRISIEPVTLGGVVIKWVTGFNAKYIVDNKIGIGAIISVIRSGDVIPHITSIISGTSGLLPKIPYYWSDTHVDIYSEDNSESAHVKLMDSFFTGIGAKNIGIKTLEKLYTNGYDSILSIIKADPDDFTRIPGIETASANRIHSNAINALKNSELALVLASASSLGPNIGYKKVQLLLTKYPNILYEYDTSKHKDWRELLLKIPSFSDITTDIILSHVDTAKAFYDNIKPYIKQSSDTSGTTSGNLANKIIVFTGFRDTVLEEEIVKQGGTVSNTLSKNVSMVVTKDDTVVTTKIAKAKKLGIEIVNYDIFKMNLNKNVETRLV